MKTKKTKTEINWMPVVVFGLFVLGCVLVVWAASIIPYQSSPDSPNQLSTNSNEESTIIPTEYIEDITDSSGSHIFTSKVVDIYFDKANSTVMYVTFDNGRTYNFNATNHKDRFEKGVAYTITYKSNPTGIPYLYLVSAVK